MSHRQHQQDQSTDVTARRNCRWTRRRSGWAVACIALVLAGCSSPGSGAPGSVPTSSATGSSTTGASGLKPLILGLIDKGSEGPYHLSQPFPVTSTANVAAFPSAFAGVVVNETWAQLEPGKGQFDFTPLDQSLAAVTSYNSAHPTDQLSVKLRIWGGFTAPQWAKTMDGAPLSAASGTGSTSPTGTVGRFWLADYETQWTDFQTALAARYDTDPLVREVAVTSCATITAEPFVITGSVIKAISAAGWTSADQQQCLLGALGNYGAWHTTGVDFTFNPFTDVSTSGARSTNFAFTSSVMQRCATSTGSGSLPRCILDNHGLTDTVPARAATLYAEIDTLWQHHGTPVVFQTIAPSGFSLCQAVGVGIAHHAQSIEVWPPSRRFSGYAQYPEAQLQAWNHALATGTQPNCG